MSCPTISLAACNPDIASIPLGSFMRGKVVVAQFITWARLYSPVYVKNIAQLNLYNLQTVDTDPLLIYYNFFFCFGNYIL